jgi:hypothetical protein
VELRVARPDLEGRERRLDSEGVEHAFAFRKIAVDDGDIKRPISCAATGPFSASCISFVFAKTRMPEAASSRRCTRCASAPFNAARRRTAAVRTWAVLARRHTQ